MLHHFDCPERYPWLPNRTPLVFDWDDESGAVTGPGAPYILDIFRAGHVDLHPCPWAGPVSSTKSPADMAAVVGRSHQLPPVLADHYPRGDDWDGLIHDPDGNIIGQVDF